MTRQESFKRRVRARMEKTGERYNAARRVLIQQAASGRKWVAEPEMSDQAVREATGRGWDEWWDVIDAWPGDHDEHAAIATKLESDHGLEGWWAQSVTVGYERITGRRLPHQRPDGTFTASKSRTVSVDGAELREMLLDDDARPDLFPGFDTELRSRPTSKVLRVSIGGGIAQISIDAQENRRAKVTVAHEQLSVAEDVERWKHYWSEWLAAINDEA